MPALSFCSTRCAALARFAMYDVSMYRCGLTPFFVPLSGKCAYRVGLRNRPVAAADAFLDRVRVAPAFVRYTARLNPRRGPALPQASLFGSSGTTTLLPIDLLRSLVSCGALFLASSANSPVPALSAIRTVSRLYRFGNADRFRINCAVPVTLTDAFVFAIYSLLNT
jgi:hypothetical protein